MFSFGVNDTATEGDGTRVAFDDSVSNARAILEEARQRYPVLMVGLTPVVRAEQDARVVQLSEELARICGDMALPYLHVYESLRASGTWTSEAAAGDGAHPGAGGYSELAQLVEVWPAWKAWLE